MRTLKKPTVLVVDDVPGNVEILLEILDDLCEIAVALDGESALDAVFENKPDLILLDIMMPKMDGYEVCRRLKEDPVTRDIPIIFVTALDSIEDESKGLVAGAIDYITKPFNLSVVRTRVKNHLALCEAFRLREDVEMIMRHDLKNPLSFIMSAPELIMMTEDLSEQSVKILKQIEASGQKLLTMINHSLDTFKMERGMYNLNPVKVNLLMLFRRIINEQQGHLNKQIHILMILDGEPVRGSDVFEVSGEELLCYTLFSNLLNNALEASPYGEDIVITMESLLPKRITIQNQGVVPEEIRDVFFEKYSTSGKKSGTGLGTYSAALITETLEGNIQMETSEASGTSIVVNLPGVR